jgi:cation diffusion facilitator CzcD-associated flavoprotein CzcO
VHRDVVIVGAGFAGIGAGIRLKRRGIHSFLILERAEEVGGTWRDNDYPGVACDVPSHLYSFSFRPNPDWSSVFSPGDEIQRYLVESAHDEGLAEHLRFGTNLLDASWRDGLWHLTTSAGALTAGAVIMACGRLSEPRIPQVPGIGGFTGELFHSARWRHDVDLTGKRVAVVGSGASAIQIVPRLAEVAAEVVVLQRSAPYIVPRDERRYTDAERGLFRRMPDELGDYRSDLFWKAEEAFAQRSGDPASTARARQRALSHLAAQVPDPVIRELLTPDYEIGCKRVLISNDYYPSFSRANVRLERSALSGVDGGSLITANGARHEVDVAVLATGFHSAEQPYAALVHGRGGLSLAEHWADGMTAHASTVVHGFPNLFVLNGPNGGLGHNSAIYMIESQLDYVLGALQFAGEELVLEVSEAAELDYTATIGELAAGTVWTAGGCESWYLDPRNGRLTLLWPDFAHAFRAANGEFDPGSFDAVPRRAVRN